MSKALIITSLVLSTLSCLGVIASFLYFNKLHRQNTSDLEKYNKSQEQWASDFSKWREDISGYVSSLYDRFPVNSFEQENLPVGIGL